jgi:excisionase family DNA binding protein
MNGDTQPVPVQIPLAPIAPLLLDETQAAAMLSLSARKLWELAACGAIKSVKIGTLKRYRRIDLEEWVTSGCPTE